MRPPFLADLRAVAQVDRARLRVHFTKPTQGPAVHAELNRYCLTDFVKPVGGHPSNTDTEFTFWLQDPDSPRRVQELMQRLGAWRPMVDEPQVLGIEVAVDFHPTTQGSRNGMADFGLYLFKGQGRPPSQHRVVTWTDEYPSGKVIGRFAAASEDRELREALVDGKMLICGERDAELISRIYLKRTDTVAQGQHQALPLHEHRVRFERTMQGACCPFSSLEAWQQFRFEDLAKDFRVNMWARPPAAVAYVAAGRPADPVRRAQRKRMNPPGTVADLELAEVVRGALRRLSSQQRGVGRLQAVDRALRNVGFLAASSPGAHAGPL